MTTGSNKGTTSAHPTHARGIAFVPERKEAKRLSRATLGLVPTVRDWPCVRWNKLAAWVGAWKENEKRTKKKKAEYGNGGPVAVHNIWRVRVIGRLRSRARVVSGAVHAVSNFRSFFCRSFMEVRGNRRALHVLGVWSCFFELYRIAK